MKTPDVSKLEMHLIAAVPSQGMRNIVRPLLRLLLRSKWSALTIHWVFQGLLNMDRTERLFKLGADIVLTLVFWAILRLLMVEYGAVLLALVIAHSVNFIFNGQAPSILLHYGVRKYNRQALLQLTQIRSSNLSLTMT